MRERENDEEFLARIASELRRELPAQPDFVSRVMQSVREEVARGNAPARADIPRIPVADIPRAPAGDIPRMPASDIPRRPEGVLHWMVRPRTVRVSPLVVAALAAGIAAVLMLPRLPGNASAPVGAPVQPGSSLVTPVASAPVRRSLQFVLVAPKAASVSVVGDFNDWDASATPMQKASGEGLWTMTIPLAAGRHQYAFLIDGKQWVLDPTAPTAVEDDFGTPNSVVTVGEGQT